MDEKSSSSWDDLVNELGVTPAPDALERRRPVIETRFDPPPAASHAPTPTTGGDWNALAAELGVEVPPEEQAKAARPKTERPRTGPGALEATFAAIEPIASPFEEIIKEEIADVEFAEGEADGIEFDDDESVGASGVDDEVGEAAEGDLHETDDLPPSALSGEAARNAFEALFQAGSAGGQRRSAPKPQEPARGEVDDIFGDFSAPRARPERTVRVEKPARAERPLVDDVQQDAAEEERPRRRRRRRGGRGRSGTSREQREEQPAVSERSVDDWHDDDEVTPEEDVERTDVDDLATSEEGDEERGPRRRRSRRGRGRGRSASSQGADAESPERRPAPRNERQLTARASDDLDSEDDGDVIHGEAGSADDDDDSASARSVHKSIPSWSEAIGVMVETNMQSRKNSPQRPPASRGGRGRGRGRGGRGGGRRPS